MNFILHCTGQKGSSFHLSLTASTTLCMSDQMSKWKDFFFAKPVAQINVGPMKSQTFSHCHWCHLHSLCYLCVLLSVTIQ